MLEKARDACARGAWADACRLFAEADARTPIEADDLERLAVAAFLVGDDAGSIQARARAHAAFLERGDRRRAARNAFWLAFAMLDKPRSAAQAGGWLARAQRLVDDTGEDCVEQGWLLCASGRMRAAAGDLAAAHDAFVRAAAIGERFQEQDLIVMARHGQGRALLMMNRAAEGVVLIDEVMIAVTAGEVAPMIAGAVYCSVITACHDVFDLHRAQEWTNALQDWCASHPDVVPFRGHCRIRRSELMQLHGAWQEALDEIDLACAGLGEAATSPEAGAAYYQRGELHRLRGEFATAEEAYRLAHQAGHRLHPGLALLRLAQGQPDLAAAAIRLALQETRAARPRTLLLSAATEILLACGDVAGARETCDELSQLTARFGGPFAAAMAAQAEGAVRLAEGTAPRALESLQTAKAIWRDLEAPFELAQTRISIGRACRQMGDIDGAQLEFEAAYELFDRLGAATCAARAAALAQQQPPSLATPLTGRELEVLRLIATGATNRRIAVRLAISEKTVARHISNIFTKLDLPSRAAATAYAYEQKLL
jgi:DNA-binding CsgD family transcriptional regulator